MKMKASLLFLLLLLASFSALAVEPDEILKDAVLERRAREISRTLRCLVCQGESIDDSSASLAQDMRRIVRARLTAGDADEEVRRFLQDRYGDFILLRPPLEKKTWLLWLTPLLTLAAGLAAARKFFKIPT